MDAHADGAPNQMTAPMRAAGSLGQLRSDSDQQLYIPSSAEGSPTKGGSPDDSATPGVSKLSTIVSHVVSDEGSDDVCGTALSTVGEGAPPKRSAGTGPQEVVGGAPAQAVEGTTEVKVATRRSGLFACCFAAPDTLDAKEQLRMSMLNDHTHHAGSMAAAGLPAGAALTELQVCETGDLIHST